MTFLVYLNNYRARGKLILKKLTITYLCDLFIIIMTSAIKRKHYKLIQFSMILSLTYYHLKEEQNETNKINKNDEDNKIFMTEYLKKIDSFQEISFWLNYLEELINEEIEKIKKRNESIIDEKQKSVAISSSIFSLIKSMTDYGLEELFILNILDEIYKKYDINESEKNDILNFLNIEMKENKLKNDKNK